MVSIIARGPEPLVSGHRYEAKTSGTKQTPCGTQRPDVVVQVFDHITERDAIERTPLQIGQGLDRRLPDVCQTSAPTERDGLFGEVQAVDIPVLLGRLQEVTCTTSDVEKTGPLGQLVVQNRE
jgi:hypothetical protein